MAKFIKSEDRMLCGGIVYEPDTVDLQGDWTTAEEIWKALETFSLNGHRLGFEHDGDADAVVVESFQAERPTYKGGEVIPAGAWYLCVKVLDEELWAKVKAGEINSFSMAGRAKTTDG